MTAVIITTSSPKSRGAPIGPRNTVSSCAKNTHIRCTTHSPPPCQPPYRAPQVRCIPTTASPPLCIHPRLRAAVVSFHRAALHNHPTLPYTLYALVLCPEKDTRSHSYPLYSFSRFSRHSCHITHSMIIARHTLILHNMPQLFSYHEHHNLPIIYTYFVPIVFLRPV